MCSLRNQSLTVKNQARFLYITTIRGCFICFLLPLRQVLYGITVTNVQLWPAIFLGNGVVNLVPAYRTTFLYPFTNVTRDCRHIQTAQKNLETLPNFAQTTSITEAATIFTKSRTKPVVRRCISHLPIQPPAWCRLPSDKIANVSPLVNSCLQFFNSITPQGALVGTMVTTMRIWRWWTHWLYTRLQSPCSTL
jgi:hypothetical protein